MTEKRLLYKELHELETDWSFLIREKYRIEKQIESLNDRIEELED